MIASDITVLLSMLRGQRRGSDQRQRLEQFYAPQAAHYDRFRDRLLAGREAMLDRLCLAPGQRVVELGCGTGRNLDFLEPSLRAGLAEITLVDLCPSLLTEAERRTRDWSNVRVVEADATRYAPPAPVDRVYLSYALSMIPDWRGALRNACRMLRPGGLIGVVDFCPPPGNSARARLAAAFWRRWFAHDGVMLDRAHGRFLDGLFDGVWRSGGRAAVPYLPLARTSHFMFIGRK